MGKYLDIEFISCSEFSNKGMTMLGARARVCQPMAVIAMGVGRLNHQKDGLIYTPCPKPEKSVKNDGDGEVIVAKGILLPVHVLGTENKAKGCLSRVLGKEILANFCDDCLLIRPIRLGDSEEQDCPSCKKIFSQRVSITLSGVDDENGFCVH